MAQNLPPYAPNRYVLAQNHQLQHAPPPQQQQQQQQAPGYYPNPPPTCLQQQQSQSLSRPPPQQHSYMMGCFGHNPNNGWAGIPLISTAPRRPRKITNFSNNLMTGTQKPRILIANNSTDFDENAMSRLAIHAHGAPLILAGRYRNRIQKRDGIKPIVVNGNTASPKKSNEIAAANVNLSSGGSADGNSQNGQSVVSTTPIDENTNNVSAQDTCLPRIIKPRKRRKKDRKPQNTNSIVVCLPETANQSLNMELHSNRIVTQDNVRNSIGLPPSSMGLSMDAQGNNFDCSSLRNNFLKLPETMDAVIKRNEDERIAACCCQICDPSCRIWAFPLRRSCSDNTAELELQKAKDVGVIGSNRSSSMSRTADWRGGSSKVDSSSSNTSKSLFRNGSFSDSGDSGCDLLNGFNFGDGDHLFYNGTGSNQLSPSPIGDDRGFIDFPTAETLLTESINEISKKLMETVDLRSDLFSSDSSSVFSDSVLSDDMLFNIENLARNCTSNNNNNNNISCNKNTNMNNNNNSMTTFYTNSSGSGGSDLLNDFYNHNHLISNSISNITGNYLLNGGDNNNNSNISNSCNYNNNNNGFVMFHEKDRENEIFNCFDMVWSRDGGVGIGNMGISTSNGSSISSNHHANVFGGARQLLPIEEQRIQLQTSG